MYFRHDAFLKNLLIFQYAAMQYFDVCRSFKKCLHFGASKKSNFKTSFLFYFLFAVASTCGGAFCLLGRIAHWWFRTPPKEILSVYSS